MKLVIKIGGQGAEDPKGRKDLARQIAAIHRAGHSVVVVHGGGKVLTRTLERMGIATEFHQGLRVTDAATRDVAMMVLAGLVNKQWVAELENLRQPALGLCGGDGSLVRARKLTVGTNGSKRDLGFVGRPHKVKTTVLDLALRGGMIPGGGQPGRERARRVSEYQCRRPGGGAGRGAQALTACSTSPNPAGSGTRKRTCCRWCGSETSAA